VRDKVSHPYKTRGKIMVLYILMLRFLERRLEKSVPRIEFVLNIFVNSILSCYCSQVLELATFSKDVLAVGKLWYIFVMRHNHIRGCIQKFPDWPHGARTANGAALSH
jgi:hypothetical protein